MIEIPGRIPIRIHPMFWLLAVAISVLNSMAEFEGAKNLPELTLSVMIWMFVVFFSVLVHEYGHALTALFFGQEAEIHLVGVGGLTQRKGKKLSLWQDFIVVLNGPLFGFLLYFLAFYFKSVVVNPSSTLLTFTLSIMIWVNLFWTLLNLLPIMPLDGGRLVSIILEGIFGVKGIKFAFLASTAFAALIGISFFAFGDIFLGSIFFILAFESYRNWQSSRSLSEQDQNEELQQYLKQAEQRLEEGRLDDALELFEKIRSQTKAGLLYLASVQYIANILYEKGKIKEAYTTLLPLSDSLTADGTRLLQRLAYQNQDWKAAISYGDKAYREAPNYDSALINAICYSILGDPRPSVGWLQCAIREGMPHVRMILEKAEFDKIRSYPLFQELEKKFKSH